MIRFDSISDSIGVLYEYCIRAQPRSDRSVSESSSSSSSSWCHVRLGGGRCAFDIWRVWWWPTMMCFGLIHLSKRFNQSEYRNETRWGRWRWQVQEKRMRSSNVKSTDRIGGDNRRTNRVKVWFVQFPLTPTVDILPIGLLRKDDTGDTVSNTNSPWKFNLSNVVTCWNIFVPSDGTTYILSRSCSDYVSSSDTISVFSG